MEGTCQSLTQDQLWMNGSTDEEGMIPHLDWREGGEKGGE